MSGLQFALAVLLALLGLAAGTKALQEIPKPDNPAKYWWSGLFLALSVGFWSLEIWAPFLGAHYPALSQILAALGLGITLPGCFLWLMRIPHRTEADPYNAAIASLGPLALVISTAFTADARWWYGLAAASLTIAALAAARRFLSRLDPIASIACAFLPPACLSLWLAWLSSAVPVSPYVSSRYEYRHYVPLHGWSQKYSGGGSGESEPIPTGILWGFGGTLISVTYASACLRVLRPNDFQRLLGR